MEKFKAGQIVPRRLNLVAFGRSRHQHRATFGCDVEVSGRTVIGIPGTGECIIRINANPYRRGGRQERVRGRMENVHITMIHDDDGAGCAAVQFVGARSLSHA